MADENLEDIRRVLRAFSRIARDPNSYRQSLDKVDQKFSEALDEETRSAPALTQTESPGKARQMAEAVMHVLRPPRTIQEVLDRLQKDCDLTNGQLRLLKETGLVTNDSSGRPMLRDGQEGLLTAGRACAYFFVIGCLTSLAVCSVVFDPNPGIGLVLRGFALGLAIGGTAGFVLGRSFRAYPIVEKINAFAPWVNVHAHHPT